MADEEDKSKQPIVIKKIIQGGGHHGGAWKVAYADFVTAMMAFFLLLWLLNVTTDEQKNAISNYFDPTHPKVSDNTSGAGGVLGGLTMSPQGAMSSTQNPLTPQQARKTRSGGEGGKKSKAAQEREATEAKEFKSAEEKLKQAIQENPALAELAKNLIIDMTPEGLRIQIVDQDGKSMFPSGSARMYEQTRELLKTITKIVIDMPNELSVRGHTDASKYAPGATYTNWELSADRANASRRVILESGMPLSRLNNVMGKADTEPLIVDNPADPRNRRITIILLKQELTNPLPDEALQDDEMLDDEEPFTFDEEEEAMPPPQVPVGTFRRTPGAIEFP